MNTKHIDQKNIKCLTCDKMFFDIETMNNHHLGHQNMTKKCRYCKKDILAAQYKRHLLKHRNLLECSLCNLKLYNRSQLNAHLKTHAGTHPYSCGGKFFLITY